MRCSSPGWRAARAGCRRRCWSPSDPRGDYAFLNLKAPAFDFSDRGVTGRIVPAGLDAFVYHRARRLSHRRNRACHRAAARSARASRRSNVPLTLVVERPDGVEYRRAVVADQGLGGRNLDVPIAADGRDRHLARARLYRSQAPAARRGDASWSRTTCPTGWSSTLASHAAAVATGSAVRGDGRRPLPLRRAGQRSRHHRRASRCRPPLAAPGLPAISSAPPTTTRPRPRSISRSKTCPRPMRPARPSSRHHRQVAGHDPAAGGAGHGQHGGAGRPRHRAHAGPAGDAGSRR